MTEAFKDRKFKYSGTATLLVISVVVVTLIINLLCGLVPLKLDITANRLYSISNKTVSILNRLEEDINIYFIYQIGAEDSYVMELADRYVAASDKIHTELVDPISNPGFVNDFALDDNKSSTIPTIGSVVVECESTGAFVTLTSADFYVQRTDDDGTTTQLYYEGEEALTNAISAVTSELVYEIAVLTGHNESTLPENVQKMLSKRFMKVTEVNLQEEKKLPDGTSVLVVYAPEYDITEMEKDIILDFLDPKDSAGSLIYIAGKASGETPYLDEVMAYYSVTLSDKVIYEEETKNYAAGIKYNLMLDYTLNSTTSVISTDQKVLLGNAKPIFTNPDLSRQSVIYSDIAFTSKKAWASDKPKTGTLEYNAADGDIMSTEGFVPILAIEEWSDSLGTKKSKVLIVNCENFLGLDEAAFTGYANDEIFYSSLFWAIGDDATQITLSPKYYLMATHSLSTHQIYVYGIVLGVIIPLAILGSGLAVYLKRRHL